MSNHLMTADEVAERLQVPRTWVYRAAREGDLPSVRCGRYRRFDADDVDRWIADRKPVSVTTLHVGRTRDRRPPSPARS